MGNLSIRGSQEERDYKFSVVQEYLASNLSISSFCRKKSVNRSTFHGWLLTFGPESKSNADDMGKQRSESEEIRELKRQLQQKEVELKQARMRADFYETMVEVAEEQFNITIRKKAGTKQ